MKYLLEKPSIFNNILTYAKHFEIGDSEKTKTKNNIKDTVVFYHKLKKYLEGAIKWIIGWIMRLPNTVANF